MAAGRDRERAVEEARGEVRAGRFVTGFSGEQYALPEAVSALRRLRREPPPGALTVPNAALPPALRRFQPRGTTRPADPVAPQAEPLAILFPPDGAEVELTQGRLVVRVRGGAGPYTWLLDGRPVAVGSPDPATQLPAAPGWATLSVIDATGRSARSGLRLIGPG